MSFPSSHASAAFAGFGFLALYLNAKFKVIASEGLGFRHYYRRDETPKRVGHWKLIMFAAPWCIACVLALSKVGDG